MSFPVECGEALGGRSWIVESSPSRQELNKGAFEALTWLQGRMRDLKDREKRWDTLKREVDDAKEDVIRGVGIDFRLCLQKKL